jgi:hypothetical protein
MDVVQAAALCDDLHALVGTLAIAAALEEVHRGHGDDNAVEGVKQTGRTALARIRENLAALDPYFQ